MWVNLLQVAVFYEKRKIDGICLKNKYWLKITRFYLLGNLKVVHLVRNARKEGEIDIRTIESKNFIVFF